MGTGEVSRWKEEAEGGGTNEEGVATVKERGGVGGSGSDREG